MAKIERFEDLDVWQEARALVLSVYGLTRDRPLHGDRNLCDQLQRAAVSIMANIAEGFERGSNRQLIQFLVQARGLAGEVRSLLYVARDLGFITEDAFQSTVEHAAGVARLFSGFIRYLKQSESRAP